MRTPRACPRFALLELCPPHHGTAGWAFDCRSPHRVFLVQRYSHGPTNCDITQPIFAPKIVRIRKYRVPASAVQKVSRVARVLPLRIAVRDLLLPSSRPTCFSCQPRPAAFRPRSSAAAGRFALPRMWLIQQPRNRCIKRISRARQAIVIE